jgi:hypothetical protein
MLLAWRVQGILTIAGYTSSASRPTRQRLPRRDIAIVQEEMQLGIIEFFCLTPLPGSEDGV